MMFLSNVEIRRFIKGFIGVFLITILLSLGVSYINVNIIKGKVIENNQAILGQILSKNPDLENEIVDIITQGKSKENIELGKGVLNKYNYDSSISLEYEPIISSSINEIFNINVLFVIIIFILFLILSISYFKKIYRDIKDMTDYVYHSSEGRSYEMKNRNQEGQIGLLKTELLKMTTILKEKVELLNNEKIFLNKNTYDFAYYTK